MAPTVLLECSQNKVVKRSFEMMGKSQKLSKDFPSSYVPDYRYVAETMGETEGFGSSCRVDSDDSSAPKRKRIGLSTEKDNYFNVPLQVFTYTKMPLSERKELELKLKSDLEKIQFLQKKFLTKSLQAVSSSSNGHGKKMGSNVPKLKRGNLGRFESTKQKAQAQAQAQAQLTNNNSNATIMKQCESILNKLRTHQFGWVFNNPVDVVALKIPDYYTVIKHPMDLGTIKNKLTAGAYSSSLGFVADVRLTFTNAMTYNPPGNDVHIMADKLSKFFESKWKPLEKKLPVGSIDDLHMNRETEAAKTIPQQKKRKSSPLVRSQFIKEKLVPKVSIEERHQVSNRLSAIAENMPDSIIDFLSKHINSTNNEEIEVDFDVLNDDVILELKKLLDDCFPERPTEHKSNEKPSEMEVVNKPELSNSSMHPNKGNEPIDEDVDIGDNDPLISSYPPVVIDKDATHRSSKCSSSSSSSSESSSSSSGSDSGSSSSESETGGIFLKAAKDDAAATKPEQEKSIITNTADINKTVGESDQSEHNASPNNPIRAEGDGLQDGENALSERHVSPDKLYRAALLRSRFADTIIKAREKTLDQGDKGDHEKLRQEREELERQQKEEKARLQAEAKVAEAARKCAEAAAAAEAKHKRELEREAARQELLKVEKTVEINENCSIMKDLEMLEESPDHIEDAMGSFKIGGSNPLEQLGLYMKDEEEEEEDPMPDKPILRKTNDTEEGEID